MSGFMVSWGAAEDKDKSGEFPNSYRAKVLNWPPEMVLGTPALLGSLVTLPTNVHSLEKRPWAGAW